jgi:beta-lactam-binding protein with PASTA domain
MPDVTGKSLQDAADQLHSRGFTNIKVRGDNDRKAKVTDQSVSPGQSVSPDTPITLTASKSGGLIGGN